MRFVFETYWFGKEEKPRKVSKVPEIHVMRPGKGFQKKKCKKAFVALVRRSVA